MSLEFTSTAFSSSICVPIGTDTPVIDAAHEVFQHCSTMYGTKRVICEDAREGWQEIIPKNGAFEISPYQDTVPFKVEVNAFVAGGRRFLPSGGV
ncbi:hypothetical protein ACG873_29450 [Mesorhizobium sp. AaZ16]|uniref:hypothetical protein n=1 Tax=Mesorhizobium sp. AaZ16 TaxID=3402289 RepID=UPI00374EF32E